MRTPGEASRDGERIAISPPNGVIRAAVHAFDLEGGGLAWTEPGWTVPDLGLHAHHAIPGTVEPVAGMPDTWTLTPTDTDAYGSEWQMFLAPESRPEGERSEAADELEDQLEVKVTR
jgi:hypothetical protein